MDISLAESLLGYIFNDKSLLIAAFIPLEHKVMDKEDKPPIYTKKKLALLGDAVLELLTTIFLIERGSLSNTVMTDMRTAIVCNKHLAYIYNSSCVNKIRNMTPLYYQNPTSRVRGNYVEGVLGAIFVDGGYQAASNFATNIIFDGLTQDMQTGQTVFIREFIERYTG
jgi:dsRNA-specific ribonuclease